MRPDQEPSMTTDRRIPRAAAVTLLAAALSPVATLAADDTIERRFAEMAERIQALEQDNAGLRQEVTKLRDESGDPWLTEQRAAEIRSLVTDVLADADSRSSLQASGLTAGWNDGFFLASPDGRFRLQVDGQSQIRYIINRRDRASGTDLTDRYRTGFENTRTRLTLRGHVFGPQFSYLVRGGFSREGGGTPVNGEVGGGDFRLYDAWVRYQFDDMWSLRFGQFKLPFNREELVSSARQLAVERSLVNESMNIGRSQGIELTFQGDWLRWAFAFSDGGSDSLLGVNTIVGTQGANTPWSVRDTEYAFTTRVETLIAGQWRQFEQFTSPAGDPFGLLVGAAVHYQAGEWGTTDQERTWLNTTVDVSLALGGANVFGALTYTYADARAAFGIFDIFGAVVQGGVYVAPKLELFGRLEYGHIDSRRNIVDPKDLWLVTSGVNYYFDGHDVKFTADVGFGINDVSQFWSSDIAGYRPDGNTTNPQIVIRTQFQLLF